jgi:hypothetical protein
VPPPNIWSRATHPRGSSACGSVQGNVYCDVSLSGSWHGLPFLHHSSVHSCQAKQTDSFCIPSLSQGGKAMPSSRLAFLVESKGTPWDRVAAIFSTSCSSVRLVDVPASEHHSPHGTHWPTLSLLFIFVDWAPIHFQNLIQTTGMAPLRQARLVQY